MSQAASRQVAGYRREDKGLSLDMSSREDGERELVVLNWGFVLLQKDKAPKRVTNAVVRAPRPGQNL
jgi:hypothetical protein